MATLTHSQDSLPPASAGLRQRLLTFNLFALLRSWLEDIEITRPDHAHWICRLIPGECPFARDIAILGHVLLHIPPLCKLNPFYDEFVSLRFRALTYLASEFGDDVITPYLR